MDIIETNLSFGAMSKRSSTSRIILHHSAADNQSVEVIHNYHKSIGYAGIGYHFYVRKDGNVYRGRPIQMVGAHALNSNYNSIGICAEGNFDTQTQPDVQVKAIQELIAYIKTIYKISKIQKHEDVNNTKCPGNNYRFDEIVKESVHHKPYPGILFSTKYNSRHKEVRNIQHKLIKRGFNCGRYGADGIFGKYTNNAVRRFQSANTLAVDGIVGKNTWNKLFN